MTTPENERPDVEKGSRLHQALALDELVHANADSNETMIRLVEQVRKDAEARNKKVDLLELGQRQTAKLLIMVAIVLLLVFGVGVINAVNISQARRNAAVTAGIAKDASATNTTLLDCLNARGECGKLNAEQQRKVLNEVKKYELTGFYCARTNPQPTDEQGAALLACMNRLYPGGPTLNKR